MKYRRHINIHFRDIQRLREFIQARNLRISIIWDTISQSGAGIAGRMNVSIPGRGTLWGVISDEDGRDLDALVSELESGYRAHF